MGMWYNPGLLFSTSHLDGCIGDCERKRIQAYTLFVGYRGLQVLILWLLILMVSGKYGTLCLLSENFYGHGCPGAVYLEKASMVNGIEVITLAFTIQLY
jgi:hypothetical protein